MVLGLVLAPGPTPRASCPPVSRRELLGATAAALAAVPRSANAAEGPAVDLVAEVGELSTRARTLQYELRQAAPSAGYARVRARVAKERKSLQRLVSAMGEAAPSLRIAGPTLRPASARPTPH